MSFWIVLEGEMLVGKLGIVDLQYDDALRDFCWDKRG